MIDFVQTIFVAPAQWFQTLLVASGTQFFWFGTLCFAFVIFVIIYPLRGKSFGASDSARKSKNKED